jgi:hypothetical protein
LGLVTIKNNFVIYFAIRASKRREQVTMAIGPITGYALHATELLETWGGDFLASDPTVCALTYFVLCWAIHLVGGLLSSLLVPSVYNKFTDPKAKPGASKLDAANYLYQKQVDWGLDLT